LGRKFQVQTAVLAVVACMLVLGGVVVVAHGPQTTTVLTAGGRTYTLDIARSEAQRAKGLSGRQSMPANQGMLFVYPNAAVRCFWMKDMHFPLDIIWISPTKQVQHIGMDVSPDTYPRRFCPESQTQYVIELNAGEAGAAGINRGQTLQF
jgi:uncharacterized protein